MKKTAKLSLIAVMLISIILSVNISALAATSGDYTYTVKNGEATISRYSGTEKVIVIPSEFDGYPVVGIGSSAFYSKSITSVVIPDTVRDIGNKAFQFCDDMESVTLGNSVETIGDYAFYECTKVKSLVLPSSLTTIGRDALVCSSSLKYLFVPESVTSIGSEGIGFKRLFVFVDPNDPYTKAIDGFQVYGTPGSAAEEYATANGFEFIDAASAFEIEALGASLRTTEPGMRYGFDIKRNNAPDFENLYSAEYGFLYTLSGSESELTLDNAGNGNILKSVAANFINNTTDMSYNLVFTQIPKTAYDTKISARAYAVINGQVYYSEIKTYCVNDVITSVMNDNEISQEIKDNIKTSFDV